jgi:predicted CopG family antitoxin
MTKNLRVSDDAYGRLAAIKRPDETLTAAFNRVIGEYNPFAGLGEILGSAEAADQIAAEDEAGRRYTA